MNSERRTRRSRKLRQQGQTPTYVADGENWSPSTNASKMAVDLTVTELSQEEDERKTALGDDPIAEALQQ
jgi:hypothetical protein